MADTKSFDQLKDEIKAKVEKGFVLDDDKMADLKEALKKNGNDISKINIKDFCKEEKQEENNNGKPPLTVNDNDDKPVAENTNEGSTDTSANEDSTWKQDCLHDWREWAQNNNLLFEDSNVPTGRFDVSFRLYENEDKKKEKDFAAEISYKGPNNMTLRGPKGKTPDDRFFNQAVVQAMKNGPDIEFGDIKNPEFKAKLMVACYANGANMLKAPSEEEISKWPKDLQDMVNKAKEAAANHQPERTQENTPEKSEEAPSAAAARIAEIRSKIQSRQQSLQTAEEAAKAAGKKLQAEEIKNISQEGMSAEEIKLRELRGQAKGGDKTAGHELDKRRYNTMTDEFKYEREAEMEADGKTPKKDKEGKTIYKKDKDGKDIYKTNDKGQKIKTAAYQAFLTKAGNNLSK